jgi:anti-anti-sigma factor
VKNLETETIGDISVAVMVPRLDAYTAADAEKVLKDQIAKGTKKILVDFSKTEYIASAGLRVLLSAAKSLHNSGGKIILFPMKSQVYEVFEVSGFNRIFKIFTSRQEALDNLR